MRLRKHALMLAVLVATLLYGCDVHQWPEPKQQNMSIVNAGLKLRLHYEPDFWVWEHRYDPVQGIVIEEHPDQGVDEEHPGTTSRYDGTLKQGFMRIIIRAFRPNNLDRCIREYVFTRDISEGYDCDLDLDLDEGDYVLAVWSDMLEQPADAPYYDPTDFRSVRLIYAQNYRANTDYRDGYRGRISLTATTNDYKRYEVLMRRPMAKLEFITTDLSEFLEKEKIRRGLSSRAPIEDYVIEIAYTGYLPCAYSVIEDRLENSTTGVKFGAQVEITGESEASLGFDYVLINDTKAGGVQAIVSVFDMTGEQVARSRQINVPLRRDHHTILRGAFLTTNASGGVGIDPGYDGDHNIVP